MQTVGGGEGEFTAVIKLEFSVFTVNTHVHILKENADVQGV